MSYSEEHMPSRYRLIRRLRVGFAAEIWECEVTFPKETPRYALRLNHWSRDDPRSSHEFGIYRLMARWSGHPGMLCVHEVGEMFGKPYMVGELMDGDAQCLIKPVADDEQNHLKRLLHVIGETANALDWLNGEGWCHGGICPQHLLLGRDRIALTGFRRLSQIGRTECRFSRRDLAARFHTSPELAGGEASAASDQYSLAATYLSLRAGVWPSGEPQWTPPLLFQIRPKERSALERALAKDPKYRFPSCREFFDGLSDGLTRDRVH